MARLLQWDVSVPRPSEADRAALEPIVVALVTKAPDPDEGLVGGRSYSGDEWAARRRAAGPVVEVLCWLTEKRIAETPSLSPVRALDQVFGEALGFVDRFNR